ncbi:polysaccharide deacetylase family protein [Magnetospirillum sp. UT-4]|uniref:polysaccharide deacetylase family protein n=1 Tax=Magnetospirillum sp. UT-4 TaxID=2681467 RepID=UPI00137E73E2|nr:polysaccharide deacetylase family protein [Magnetospirillum sp. UT-4]CAA7612170.1 conserved hypothetical protein [Magnetospirillum sp. UT-4]
MAGLATLLAPPLLAATRILNALTGGHGHRLLLLHDVPPEEMAALDRLAGSLTLAPPAELEALLDGRARPRAATTPTFDDGFASNLEAAAVVEGHGGRAIFFVCPGLIDLPWPEQRAAIAANVFNGRRRPEDIPERMRLMTWDELRGLAARGHVIANHTMSHRRLTTLDAAGVEAEIGQAAARLAAELGAKGDWFAFPFGDIGSIGAEALTIAARHHRFCRSGIRGPNRNGTSPAAVLADHVDLAAPVAYQRLAAEGGLDWRYRAARRRLAEYTV